MNVIIVGGHGNVAMRLARLLTARPNTKVTSLIRTPDHIIDVAATGATPLVLSLTEATPGTLAAAFEGADIVYFAAGAGGKGGVERTQQVDCDGAIKVFDALELVRGAKPRLILVSCIDVRDRNVVPAHYTAEDVKNSDMYWASIGWYMQAKYDADKDLVKRTAFKWTMLRPGTLTHEPGTGKAIVGKVPLGPSISRDDVALALALLADRPEAAGLAIDLNGGSGVQGIEEGLDAFIKKGESDFSG